MHVVPALLFMTLAAHARPLPGGLPQSPDERHKDIHQTTLYEKDRREELYSGTPAERGLGASVAALMETTELSLCKSCPDESRYTLVMPPRSALGMASFKGRPCPGERFAQQPTNAFCTGTLIGPDLVLTAWHCVPTARDCKKARLVFGYALGPEGRPPSAIGHDDVYSCSSIIKSGGDHDDRDWSILRLDRAVTGRTPLLVNLETLPTRQTPLFVIGHPSGLPAKIAREGVVDTYDRCKGTAQTRLDAFPGNSGSAVFNAESYRIEGVLIQRTPVDDYVRTPQGCMTAKVVPKGAEGSAKYVLSTVFADEVRRLLGRPVPQPRWHPACTEDEPNTIPFPMP